MSLPYLCHRKKQCLSKHDSEIVSDLKVYGWVNCAGTRTFRVCYFGPTVQKPRTIYSKVFDVGLTVLDKPTLVSIL